MHTRAVLIVFLFLCNSILNCVSVLTQLPVVKAICSLTRRSSGVRLSSGPKPYFSCSTWEQETSAIKSTLTVVA